MSENNMTATTTTTGPVMRNIKDRLTLKQFAMKYGPTLQIGDFKNKKTGKEFKSCVFTKNGSHTFVEFSSKLGELTPEQIVAMKDGLQVVELYPDPNKENDGPHYSLCRIGNTSWVTVDLGW